MTIPLQEAARRLIDESLWMETVQRCRRLGRDAQTPAPCRRRLQALSEAIDSADWAKIGLLLGLAWYRLDRLISQMEQINRGVVGAERNTGNMVSKLDTLIQLLRSK